MLAIALLAKASASLAAPVHLETATGPLDLTPGTTLGLDASLVNDTKAELRLQRDSALRYTIMCRGPLEPPGQTTFGTGSRFGGSVFGGVEDAPKDPADPKFCRSYPPKTMVIPAGGSLP